MDIVIHTSDIFASPLAEASFLFGFLYFFLFSFGAACAVFFGEWIAGLIKNRTKSKLPPKAE